MSAELTPLASGLVTLAAVKVALGITDTSDDARLADLIRQAEAAIAERWTLPTVPRVTATRPVWVDGASVWADELVSVTGVADLDGSALLYITEPSGGEHLARLILHDQYTGTVSVTGVWGYTAVPADVERGIIACVSAWYTRDVRGEESAYRGIRKAIPQETVDIFEARRRVRF